MIIEFKRLKKTTSKKDYGTDQVLKDQQLLVEKYYPK